MWKQPSPFPSVSAPKLCFELHIEHVQSISVGGRGSNFFLLLCEVEAMASGGRVFGYVDLRLCLNLWWSMYSPFALTVRARSSAVRIVMEPSAYSFLCCLIFVSLWKYWYSHTVWSLFVHRNTIINLIYNKNIIIQWNLSIMDTLGATWNVLIKEVSLFKRLFSRSTFLYVAGTTGSVLIREVSLIRRSL